MIERERELTIILRERELTLILISSLIKVSTDISEYGRVASSISGRALSVYCSVGVSVCRVGVSVYVNESVCGEYVWCVSVS